MTMTVPVSCGLLSAFCFLIGEGQPYLAKTPPSQSAHMSTGTKQPPTTPPTMPPTSADSDSDCTGGGAGEADGGGEGVGDGDGGGEGRHPEATQICWEESLGSNGHLFAAVHGT